MMRGTRIILWGVFLQLLLIGVAVRASHVVYHTVDNGLSQNEVTSIIQDQTGFLWFGTRGGLNRFDGYEFLHYKPDPAIPTSLNGTSIERVFQDSRGRIWVGSKTTGLSSYDPQTNAFTSYYSSDTNDSTKLFGNRVIAFAEDHEGNIWIGTWANGVFRYNYKTGTFQHFMDGFKVLSIIQTRDKRLWFATWAGLYSTTTQTLQFQFESENLFQNEICTLIEDPTRPIIWFGGWSFGLGKFNYQNRTASFHQPIAGEQTNVYHLKIDSQGRFWVGTWGKGLFTFDLKTEKFKPYQLVKNPYLRSDFNYQIILDLIEDRNQVIWVGVDGGGVCQISPTPKFRTIGVEQSGEQFVNAHILSVLQDASGTLLMGSRGSGLYASTDLQNMRSLPFPDNRTGETVYTLFKDSQGTIWVGADFGIFWMNGSGASGRIANVNFEGENGASKILSIAEKDGDLWLGTQQRGLYVFERVAPGVLRFKKHYAGNTRTEGQLQSERISCMLTDAKGRLWLGTYNGLFLYTPADDRFTKIQDLSDAQLTSEIVLSLAQDRAGNMWVGTPNGLNKISSTDGRLFSIQNLNKSNGFADDYIHSIEEDREQNLWISTNMGLIRYNPSSGTLNHFDDSDGIQGKSFSEMASFQNKKGQLFFGGKNGVSYFVPEEIIPNKHVPKMAFTQFSVYNKPVAIGEVYNKRIILPKSVNDLESITLTYREREFSFEFAALDFINPERNQYAYMLEGYDDDWVYIGNRRHITFNNLKAGDYVLKIRGSNNNNVWCDTYTSLKIEVLPPPWKTWYALVIYIIVTLLVVESIRWNSVRQAKLASNLELQTQKQDQERRINEMKISFFTNISHEFRTPLTLISGPLNMLLHDEKYRKDGDLNARLLLIQQNTRRLLSLVNQLLDFRKAETGNLKLSVQQTDLTDLVNEVSLPFRELAQMNQFNFEVKTNKPNIQLWCDRNKVEMIFNNLVSNAFNSCDKLCSVQVHVEELDDCIAFSVVDNGCGIPAEEQGNIFKTFYQATQTRNAANTGTGTGIGLALVKELVDLHKAEIELQSAPGQGSTFTVKFKKGKAHFEAADLRMVLGSEASASGQPDVQTAPRSKTSAPAGSPKLLIVEDNQQMQQFLVDLFADLYIVHTANNGEEGYNRACSEQPNLILSDVMMPVVDGLEMCRRLKSNEETSHIPVVILTAKSSEQLKLFSTKLGADEYISKPFDPEYLKSRAANLLNAQDLMRNRFSRKVTLAPTDIEISNYEEKLIMQAKEIVEQNLENVHFNAEMLATGLGMSHSTLYRKLKALTGYSIVGFINKMKIERAAQLMQNKEMTITEIMYKVGFNDLKHFRKCFQKEFHQSPSDYRKNLGA